LPVRRAATALRRCWLPDQQRQFGMHPVKLYKENKELILQQLELFYQEKPVKSIKK